MFLEKCKVANYDIIVTSTFRDLECQRILYEQGRTRPGKIVTNAKPGYSFHNYKVAFDIVPIINGKLIWHTTGEAKNIWIAIGIIGKKCGLEWAGDWSKFKEYPHFQFTNGKKISDFLEEFNHGKTK